MYIPRHFRNSEIDKAVAFMQRYSFETLVSVSDHRPVATHLPFVIEKEDDNIFLTSHLARSNSQGEDMESGELLVIFSEPHAYISPKNYDKTESVPTWNYIAVHAYGKAKIVSDEEEVIPLLEKMINTFEPEYQYQWDDLSIDYKQRMMKGITAFKIEVQELQANEKLSQNKNEQERKRIIASLSDSEHQADRDIADYMRNNEKDRLILTLS